MKLDRDIQRKILETLADSYPEASDLQTHHLMGLDREATRFHLHYLEEHGLVKCAWSVAISMPTICVRVAITAKGLDFLSDDGGLSAILGVVTVRLDATQWAELLACKVEALPNVSHDERSEIAKALRNLPAKAIEKVSSKLLDWAVDHAGDALPLLRTLLAQAAA